MYYFRKHGWELPERAATPESVFHARRGLIKALAAGPILAAAPVLLSACDGKEATDAGAAASGAGAGDPSAGLYPVPRNLRYRVDRPLTEERHAVSYNNFYEYGTTKYIAEEAQRLRIRPWTVRIDGDVEKPFDIAIDDLLKKMPLEERVYRFRCVEAWGMTVPWSGFPMKALVDLARPLAKAKYVRMETFGDASMAPALRQPFFPWPYVEGLSIAEATHELTLIATGLYGKPLPNQNGAPLRLMAPWKYGFKNLKSIVRFTFTEERPETFWIKMGPREYGFWANVNPEVDHPRWSQATEQVLGENRRISTVIYNGYGEFVAGLYTGMENESLFM